MSTKKFYLAVASNIPSIGNYLKDFRLLQEDGFTWGSCISIGPRVLECSCVNKNLYKVFADDNRTYIIQIIGFEVVEYNKFYLAISDRIPSAGNRLDSIHILHDDNSIIAYNNKNKLISQCSPLGRNLYKVISDNSMYLVQVAELERDERERSCIDAGR